MTDDRPEDELSGEFRALRARLERPGAVPDFDAMILRARADAARTSEPPSHAPFIRRRWVPVAAAAALAGILLLAPGEEDADAEFERLVSDYTELMAGVAGRSPTAPLLHVPGVDLGAVPSFAGFGGARSERRTP